MTDAQHQTALALYGQGRHAEAASLLGQAAQGGHVPSMSLLGHQLLSGRGAPLDPVSGVRWVMAAAEQGGAMACTLGAALLAAGVGGRPDWNRALDYLQRGAELGFSMAQAQLKILAGRPGEDWKGLRRQIDIKAWRQAPKPRFLSREPKVQTFEGLAGAAVCEWIVARARDRLKPAMIYETVGSSALHDTRSNSAADWTLGDVDVVLLAVRERLAAAAGLPVMHMDAPQVLHYAPGERFADHFDFFDPEVPAQAAEVRTNGQRVATALIYLNHDGLESGETDFPALGLRHRGGRGDALVFFNTDASGRVDRRTLHAGLPPTAGEKWLFSQWIRDRPRAGAGDPRLIAALNGR